MSNTSEFKKCSENYSPDQTMRMASQFLNDVLTHLYEIQGVKVEWGAAENNTPAFQITFSETEGNMGEFGKFTEGFFLAEKFFFTEKFDEVFDGDYDEDYDRIIFDVQKNIIRFPNLNMIPDFWHYFLSVNNWYPDTETALINEIPGTEPFNPSSEELLGLRKRFYLTWTECALDCATTDNPELERLKKFVHILADIQRSLIVDYATVYGTQYSPRDAFRYH